MLLTALVFLLVLSILVFVHEFGHFICAKLFGMYVEEFGFGLPPRIWGKKIGETVYSINLLPIGGFVKLRGEDPPSSEEKGTSEGQGQETANLQSEPYADRAFYNYRKWKRVVVLTAGVAMNFLLAVVVISFIFTRGVLVPTERVRIDNILTNSPADKAGLSVNDVILEINGEKIKSPGDLIKITQKNLDQEILLKIDEFVPDPRMVVGAKPTFQQRIIKIIPRKNYPKDEGPMGIAITNLEEKKYPWYQAPIYGLKEAVYMSILMVKGIGGLLWNLITFKEVSRDVAGPLGIAQLTGQAVKFGWMAVIQLLGLLSLNLAVINILPIPALDGGRLMFIFLEKIIGRKIKAKIEMRAHQIGMAFLLALMVLITINDVIKFLKEKGII